MWYWARRTTCKNAKTEQKYQNWTVCFHGRSLSRAWNGLAESQAPSFTSQALITLSVFPISGPDASLPSDAFQVLPQTPIRSPHSREGCAPTKAGDMPCLTRALHPAPPARHRQPGHGGNSRGWDRHSRRSRRPGQVQRSRPAPGDAAGMQGRRGGTHLPLAVVARGGVGLAAAAQHGDVQGEQQQPQQQQQLGRQPHHPLEPGGFRAPRRRPWRRRRRRRSRRRRHRTRGRRRSGPGAGTRSTGGGDRAAVGLGGAGGAAAAAAAAAAGAAAPRRSHVGAGCGQSPGAARRRAAGTRGRRRLCGQPCKPEAPRAVGRRERAAGPAWLRGGERRGSEAPLWARGEPGACVRRRGRREAEPGGGAGGEAHMAGKPGRSEGRRELGAIASLRKRGWGWPLDQLAPPCPRPPRRSPLPSRLPARRHPALPSTGRLRAPRGKPGAGCSFPLPTPFLFFLLLSTRRGKWETRGCQKPQLPAALSGSWIPGSISALFPPVP